MSNLAQSEAANAFEPFWRKDPARSAPGAHCGLGLSLVRKTAAVLGGTVSVKSCEGGEVKIDLLLPRQPAANRRRGELV